MCGRQTEGWMFFLKCELNTERFGVGCTGWIDEGFSEDTNTIHTQRRGNACAHTPTHLCVCL